MFFFKKTFNEKFNLSFHPPVSDSWRKCDAYNIIIKAAETETIKDNFKQELELHWRKARSARTELQNDIELAKNNPEDVTVITFDLWKHYLLLYYQQAFVTINVSFGRIALVSTTWVPIMCKCLFGMKKCILKKNFANSLQFH